MPAISILVPVYRVPENYLRRCIESLIDQSLSSIQIILVDDGSPDECGKICDEYAAKDQRIIVIHQKNKGLAGARNTAYDKATGRYVMFLDGDDYIEKCTCEKAYNYAIEKGFDIVLWDIQLDYERGSKIWQVYDGESRELSSEECKKLCEKVFDYNGHVAQVFGKIIRRDLLSNNEIRHVEELKQGAEGLVFNSLLYQKVETAYYISEPLNHYIYNEKSISHSFSEENVFLILGCFEYIWNNIFAENQKKNIEDAFYTRLLYVVVTTAISGYFNPDAQLKYTDRVSGFINFLNRPLIKETMRKGNRNHLSKARQLILRLIESNQWLALYLLAKLRRTQNKLR